MTKRRHNMLVGNGGISVSTDATTVSLFLRCACCHESALVLLPPSHAFELSGVLATYAKEVEHD